MAEREALVIGAGVIGLTAAVRLREAGWRVRIRTEDRPEDTTSAVAAAIWYPYGAEPREKVLEWGERSWLAFRDIAREDPDAGVRMTRGVEYGDPGAPLPDWIGHGDLRELSEFRGTEEEGRARWEFTVPVINMPVYLRYLEARFGGEIRIERVERLEAVAKDHSVVVNCTGLGARDLVENHGLTAGRGQIVRVANPGLSEFVIDQRNGRLLYVIPRGADCVLGGIDTKDSEDLAPNSLHTEQILDRCRAAVPALRGAAMIGPALVGLRPKGEVRLEADAAHPNVIHDFGHGGAGVTLSWGCADRVVELAARVFG